MNSTAKRVFIGMAVTGVLGFSQAAMALTGMANSAYAGDSTRHLVSDGFGHCVRTGLWTPELALAECEPGMAPKKVAEPAPAPAPAPAPVVEAAPAPIPEPAIEKVTLKAGALFDSGKATLKPAGQGELDDLASKLKSMNGVESVEIIGYTDSQGAADFNQKLSEQRAEAVKTYLVGKGVDERVVNTRGMGESNPVASNATANGRAQNRRVELDIKASQAAR